jgi:hypothetical protein
MLDLSKSGNSLEHTWPEPFLCTSCYELKYVHLPDPFHIEHQ